MIFNSHNPKNFKDFQNPDIKYTVTSRDIVPYLTIREYINLLFPFILLDQVESLFGFTTEFSPLYGGRPFHRDNALATHHLAEMMELGVHLTLNLTNHFFSQKVWEATLPLLERHHKKGNAIICVNDRLAQKIRVEFPAYTLKASMIKNLNTLRKINQALDLYDDVVIPMEKNDDTDFLESLPDKKRMVLFGVAACAYNCPLRSCYLETSQEMQGRKTTVSCSQTTHPRRQLGKVIFDINRLYTIGFRQFKLIPVKRKNEKKRLIAGYQEHKSHCFFLRAQQENRLSLVASYPKSGRTWLRFFLANYIVLQKKLDLWVDFESMFTLFPNNIQSDFKKGREAFNVLFRNKIPLICFSHAHFSEELKDMKILMLLRRIPDVLVSEYFHFSTQQESNNKDIGQYVFGGNKQGIYRLIDYLNGWADLWGAANFCTITYEDLHLDTTQSFEKILRFFGIAVDESIMIKAIQLSSLECMKQQEADKGIPGACKSHGHSFTPRIREGKIGGYRAYLDDDTLIKIQHTCNRKLTRASKILLSANKLWPTSV